MTDRNKLFSFILLLLTSNTLYGEAAQCPANSASVQYHSLGRSQIAISASINHSGPYELMVDTGAQITVIEPGLADELKLEGTGSIKVIAVTNVAKAPLVSAAVVEAGPVSVQDLKMAVEGLGQIQAQFPGVRGILGNNFLSHFDLLIDYSRKMLCFDESHTMQQAIRGEHVVVLASSGELSSLDHIEPVLVSVHLPGDRREGTILRLDSGSNVPLLFEDRNSDSLPWLQRSKLMRGKTAGNAFQVSYALTPIRSVRLGAHQEMQVAFLVPIRDGRTFARAGEDGLLPTTLFKRVFISYLGHFVVFEPK